MIAVRLDTLNTSVGLIANSLSWINIRSGGMAYSEPDINLEYLL